MKINFISKIEKYEKNRVNNNDKIKKLKKELSKIDYPSSLMNRINNLLKKGEINYGN